MSTFAESTWFDVHHCCNCGMAFAMTTEFEKRCRKDHRNFYCPAGHAQHYTGPTEEQKLKAELERKAEMLLSAERRAQTAEQDRVKVTRAHQKMRSRVMNGVCPCCNRTFQNLMNHMKSEHPDFTEIRTLLVLRQAFGMTQADVAREVGVSANNISLHERGRSVGHYAKMRIDDWLGKHNGAEASEPNRKEES